MDISYSSNLTFFNSDTANSHLSFQYKVCPKAYRIRSYIDANDIVRHVANDRPHILYDISNTSCIELLSKFFL